MRALKRGILISLEGIDGSGKSTLTHNLTQSLIEHQFDVLLTKEPGGTHTGKKLRAIVQEQETPLDPKAEFLLFAADRAQHFTQLILPALAQNKIVLSDRMADSSLVYQGFGRGLDLNILDTINKWAMQERQPDLTIYVDIPLETSLERIQKRNEELTAFEKEKKDFTQRLIQGYNTIFKDRTNVIHLDGQDNPALLTHKATEQILSWLNKQQLL